MVDLDGARTGRRENASAFLEVADKSGLQVELGGGIRDRETVVLFVSWHIPMHFGSAALKNPALVKEAAAAYGDRIAVGIDARDGMVAAEGWLQVSRRFPIWRWPSVWRTPGCVPSFYRYCKDGMLSGPNSHSWSIAASGILPDYRLRRNPGAIRYSEAAGHGIVRGYLRQVAV